MFPAKAQSCAHAWLAADPPENYHLTVKKLPKTWHFFKKNCQKFHFFQKNCQWQFFWKKMKLFGNFFETKWQFVFKMSSFDNFLTFKWQFSGGSGRHWQLINLHCFPPQWAPLQACCSIHTANPRGTAPPSRPHSCCSWSRPSRRTTTWWGRRGSPLLQSYSSPRHRCVHVYIVHRYTQ